MQRKFIAVKGNLKTKELIIIISKNVKEEQIKPKKVKEGNKKAEINDIEN